MIDLLSQESLTVYVPKHVLFQELDGEAVLLNLETGQYYGLNKVGSRFWELAQDGNGEVSQILATLEKEFEVSLSVLKQDLGDFLIDIERLGLVKFGDHRN